MLGARHFLVNKKFRQLDDKSFDFDDEFGAKIPKYQEKEVSMVRFLLMIFSDLNISEPINECFPTSKDKL